MINAAYAKDCIRKAQHLQSAFGHIQCHCPALQRPRIAVHHGIWRELDKAISRWSTEKNKKDDNLKWFFPSAVSDSDHDEWTFWRTVVYLQGLA